MFFGLIIIFSIIFSSLWITAIYNRISVRKWIGITMLLCSGVLILLVDSLGSGVRACDILFQVTDVPRDIEVFSVFVEPFKCFNGLFFFTELSVLSNFGNYHHAELIFGLGFVVYQEESKPIDLSIGGPGWEPPKYYQFRGTHYLSSAEGIIDHSTSSAKSGNSIDSNVSSIEPETQLCWVKDGVLP
jgi:hypothetical protein